MQSVKYASFTSFLEVCNLIRAESGPENGFDDNLTNMKISSLPLSPLSLAPTICAETLKLIQMFLRT